MKKLVITIACLSSIAVTIYTKSEQRVATIAVPRETKAIKEAYADCIISCNPSDNLGIQNEPCLEQCTTEKKAALQKARRKAQAQQSSTNKPAQTKRTRKSTAQQA